MPELIEPQFYENGFPTGMFEAFDELTLDPGHMANDSVSVMPASGHLSRCTSLACSIAVAGTPSAIRTSCIVQISRMPRRL